MAADDAVQVMTVHKSKGLEFPLVAVPYLDAPFQNDDQNAVFHPVLGLGISLRDAAGKLVPGKVLEQIREENKTKEEEEKIRLLYVALTRAKDGLKTGWSCRVSGKIQRILLLQPIGSTGWIRDWSVIVPWQSGKKSGLRLPPFPEKGIRLLLRCRSFRKR